MTSALACVCVRDRRAGDQTTHAHAHKRSFSPRSVGRSSAPRRPPPLRMGAGPPSRLATVRAPSPSSTASGVLLSCRLFRVPCTPAFISLTAVFPSSLHSSVSLIRMPIARLRCAHMWSAAVLLARARGGGVEGVQALPELLPTPLSPFNLALHGQSYAPTPCCQGVVVEEERPASRVLHREGPSPRRRNKRTKHAKKRKKRGSAGGEGANAPCVETASTPCPHAGRVCASLPVLSW